MGTMREGRRGRVAAAAHRGGGGARFHEPEPTAVATEAGKTGKRCQNE